MSYNNIGLATARGSGTNGYVQRNFAALRPQRDMVGNIERFARSLALLLQAEESL